MSEPKDCKDYQILGVGDYFCPKYKARTPRPCAIRCPCDHEECERRPLR